mmetsp:Transcript_123790/g.358065  ORF Transcript_123790/g.358065 Transcript_123790/m.358065 type:complete len:263 (-) Transcript_123790:93-881(-)
MAAAALAALFSGEAAMPTIAVITGVVAAAGFVVSGAGSPPPPLAVGPRAAGEAGDQGGDSGAEATKDDVDAPSGQERPEAMEPEGQAGRGAGPPEADAAGDGDPAGASQEKTSAAEGSAAADEAVEPVGDAGAEPSEEEALLEKIGMGRRKLTPEQEAQIRKGIRKLPESQRKALEDWINMKEESIWPMVAMNILVLTLFAGMFVCFSAYLIINHEINIYDRETWRNATKLAEATLRKYRILRPTPPDAAFGGGVRSITAEL